MFSPKRDGEEVSSGCAKRVKREYRDSYDVNHPNDVNHPEPGSHSQSNQQPDRTPALHQLGAVDRQEICYGTYEDVTIINHKGFKKLFGATSSSIEELSLLQEQNGSVAVYNHQGSYGGLLCPHAVNVLRIITHDHDLRFQVFIRTGDIADTSSQKLTVRINIYGSLNSSEAVGELLLDHNIFLQPPLKFDVDSRYHNPQSYIVPGGKTSEVQEAYTGTTVHGTRLPTMKSFTMEDTLAALLPIANITPSDRSPVVSSRLKTVLLEHQLDGLAFMQERERVSHSGDNIYGGILADQPGLGKTLTALSLVAGSLPSGDDENDISDVQSTLIVVPASLLSSWESQVEDHFFTGRLRLLTYYGRRRKLTGLEGNKQHVVLTAYSTLVSDMTSKESLLYQKHWYRVILDEAHFVKDCSTKRFKAVCALETSRRWCLTGTPIHNSIEDLGGLLAYLRVAPFDDHGQFQRRIARPLLQGNSESLYTLQTVLLWIMMRHTKDILVLPPRHDVKVELHLSSSERTLYDMAREDSRSLIGICIGQKCFTKGFQIIQSMLRQRQISNHGLDLLPTSTRTELNRRWRMKGAVTNLEAKELLTFCEACNLEIASNESNTNFEGCLHLVCAKCAQPGTSLCLICTDADGAMEKRRFKTESLQAWFNELEYCRPSSKVQALVENIKESQRGAQEGQPIKSIVFSSWVRMLYLVGHALNIAGINAVRYDGTISMSERQKILSDFRSSPRITVLLMSIGSGGVGLNLTAASQVHIMEPQWNPMAEAQALDRVHRIGQKLPVKTFRYIAKSTIDETILVMQSQKLNIAELALRANDQSKDDRKYQTLLKLDGILR